MARILVTDGERRSSLAVVRSLGREGHDVHVCSVSGKSLAGASRFCQADHRVPDPRRRASAYQRAVGKVVRRWGVEVVIPTTDASAFLVPALQRAHPKVTVAFPPFETWQEASDKRRVTELAQDLGIAVPEQVVLERPPAAGRERERRVEELGYPLVLKPSRSVVRSGDRILSFGVRDVWSREELRAALADFPKAAWPILAQRRVTGPGVGVFMLTDRGRVVAAFAHRRLREKPPTGGVSVYRESIPLGRKEGGQAARLLERLGWTGVAMVEFKIDERTGTPYLMEVNGRFWGSLQLAIDAGIDFPSLLVRTALGQRVPQITSYRVGVRSRWEWGDLDHLLWLLHAPGNTRQAYPWLPSRAGALKSFLVPWRRGDKLEILRLDDPGPFLRESRLWLRSVGRRAAKERARPRDRTPPPRRRDRSRALARNGGSGRGS